MNADLSDVSGSRPPSARSDSASALRGPPRLVA